MIRNEAILMQQIPINVRKYQCISASLHINHIYSVLFCENDVTKPLYSIR